MTRGNRRRRGIPSCDPLPPPPGGRGSAKAGDLRCRCATPALVVLLRVLLLLVVLPRVQLVPPLGVAAAAAVVVVVVVVVVAAVAVFVDYIAVDDYVVPDDAVFC